MKVVFDKEILEYNPKRTYALIQSRVLNSVARREQVEPRSFSRTIFSIGKAYNNKNNSNSMTDDSIKFAFELFKMGEYNLTGIIYSFLIKFNENNPQKAEELARKALNVAKKRKDPIHIMARAYDLSQIYRNQCYGSQKHINALCEVKDNLKYIIQNYQKAKKRFNTITKEVRPLNNYEFMLCSIRMEIAKATKNTNPERAEHELLEAYKIMIKYGDGTLTQRILSLLNQIHFKHQKL